MVEEDEGDKEIDRDREFDVSVDDDDVESVVAPDDED